MKSYEQTFKWVNPGRIRLIALMLPRVDEREAINARG